MSYSNFLLHRCTTTRQSTTAQDAHNLNVEHLVTAGSNMLCRLIQKEQRVWSDEQAVALVITTYKLLLLQDANIQAKDTVVVTLEDASTITFTVEAVKPSRSGALYLKSASLKVLS